MKHTKRKISKIVNEMLTYFYSVGATKIEITLEDDVETHYITFRSDFDLDYLEPLEKLNNDLNSGRNPEIEEMYWNLTGLSDLDDDLELQLVASLIDSANVFIDKNRCTLYLMRKRAKKNQG